MPDKCVTFKVIGEENQIIDAVKRLRQVYEPEWVYPSKIQKNIGDPNFHMFVKVVVEKAPPKEQTDVKVKEVR